MNWNVVVPIVVLCGAFVIYEQHMTIANTRANNAALTRQLSDYRGTNERLTEKFLRTDSLLRAAQQEKRDEETTSHTTQAQLRQTISADECARRPVPADTLRLQRDAIERTRRAAGAH